MSSHPKIIFKARVLKAPLAFCLCGTLLMGCQSSSTLDQSAFLDNPLPASEIVLTAPIMELSDYDQLMVLKLSELLDKGSVDENERAQLFYELGIVYDRMGLESSARVMFMNALFEKADFAPAYDFMGVYLASHGMYQDAYEAFDSALELAQVQGQKRIFTHFSRAIALYYGKRPKNAMQDMLIDYNQRKGDPYRMLWTYIIGVETEGQEVALEQLRQRRADANEEQETSFGMSIVDYILGSLKKEELFSLMKDPNLTMQERIERVCEAYFYLGKQAQIAGDDRKAFWYYHLCVSTAKYDFLEHRYSRVEIDRLAKKYQLKTYLTPTVISANNGYDGEE